jgi:hypothetical protein
MLTDPRIQAFKTLCQSSSSEDLTVQEARTILLHVSKGMIPADKLIDKDGNLFTLPEVCSKTLGDLRKYSLYLGRRQLARDDFVQALKKSEDISENVCYLSHDFNVEATLPETRLEAMAAGATVGIHFFTWDGKPRDAADIRRAMCKYSTQKKVMSEVMKGLIITGVAVAILALVYKDRIVSPEQRKKFAERLSSAGVSKGMEKVKSIIAKADALRKQGVSKLRAIKMFSKTQKESDTPFAFFPNLTPRAPRPPRVTRPRPDDDFEDNPFSIYPKLTPRVPRPSRKDGDDALFKTTREEEFNWRGENLSYYKTPRRVRFR